MAENTIQPDLRIIQLCARLAKFAYTSGDPGSNLSLRQNNNEAAKTALLGELEELGAPVPASEDIIDFQRYYSHSWFIRKASQPKWFRSYAHFCHIKGRAETGVERDGVRKERPGAEGGEAIDRIIVGFRGTWNDPSASGQWLIENGAQEAPRKYWFSRIFTRIKKKLTPSSKYGLSDFYYDAMLIRIPYRKGTVWKWYAYWGSLVLERTGWASQFFARSRTVAKDWMTRPNTTTNEPNGGHVHLGFWSLWASPEGFAGYDRQGNLSWEASVMLSIRRALKTAEARNTVFYVVGHSLGGAVSSFAALDIAKELEQHSNVTMYHVTFGSPPVGTPAFATYFSSQLGRHQSWRISHERDLVPQCLTWCASKWYLGWLKWWNDWSCVGEERLITRLISPDSTIATEGGREIGIFGKCKFGMAGLGGLVMLFGLSLLAVPVSAVSYFCKLPYYSNKRILQAAQGNPGYSYKHDNLPDLGPNVGLKYHDLQKYIDLIETQNGSVNSIEGRTSEPAQIVSG